MEFKNKSLRFQDDLGGKVSTWGKKDEGNKANFESFQIVSAKPLKNSNGLVDMANPLHSGKTKVFAEDYQSLAKRIFDPGSELVQRWNKIFLITCVVALFLDPLYFYLPLFNNTASCMKVDLNLEITVTVFRSIMDLFNVLHMILKFRPAFIAPSSRVFGRGELVVDPKQIAWRYVKGGFVLDLLASLPLPQRLWLV